jgi:uncharacterized protein
MKILAVSDRVESSLYDDFKIEPFKGIDLILGCGDLPPEYLSFLKSSLDVPLFYVLGNHDIRYGEKSPSGAINLHGRLINFHGVNILGLGGSKWYNGGMNQFRESEMRQTIRWLRPRLWLKGGVDIIITHAPPRHIHDAEDLCHQGFEIYRWLISKYAPCYFIHGHIHRTFKDPSERISMVDQTRVINSYGHYIIEI